MVRDFGYKSHGGTISRDTGLAQITGPITLVQDSERTPGFLFYAPFYSGHRPTTLKTRRERFVGIVYAPFVVTKLMSGILEAERRQVRIRISDVRSAIYDELSRLGLSNDPQPMFSDNVELPMFGRSWQIEMQTNLDFRAHNKQSQPLLILLAGLLIDALLLSMFIFLSKANRRAIAFADNVAAAPRSESEALEQSNTELERFAYVASHDLKTPIRGIGGLAEMLEEDLGPYLDSPSANPEVAEYLALIKERVQRMNALIDGILRYSQVGAVPETEGAANLAAIIADFETDLGLLPGQILPAPDLPQIETDAFNFRVVLENLVVNAIRHHPEPVRATVRISAVRNGAFWRFSVSENGDGIDPRLHDKVFEIFQSLQTGPSRRTGVCLSIVRKAVLRHGGKVVTDSGPDNGATFSFGWPAGPNPFNNETASEYPGNAKHTQPAGSGR